MGDKKLIGILLAGHYVAEEDLEKAAVYAKARKTSITEYLLNEGLITTTLLGQAIAEAYKLPYADLRAHPPVRTQVNKIPETIGRKYRLLLFSVNKKDVTVASDDPKQKGLPAVLKKLFSGYQVKLAYTMTDDIDEAFVHYQKTLETRFVEILKKKAHIAPEIIDVIFEDAIMHRASDIHFEPGVTEIIVRFRVDGVMYEAGRIPKDHYPNILNRIKVQSLLRIDEHFAAQDGAIRYETKDHRIDMRVSIVPTLEGEKVAIRLLSQYVKSFTLADLGLSESDQKLIEKAAKKPFGMILSTGPTGSGKTTSLYALLKLLNQPDVNITTIEDPAEYRMVGTNQIQVNNQTGLTFAKGLRSIVRQDPDVILVGEIRDTETAEIAVNAALTGHLLLSTFHSNDAATAIPRLLDMGIEPFLLASTLEVISAQRLVRRICEHCRYSYKPTRVELDKLLPGSTKFFPKQVTFYKGKGCGVCARSGYKSRTAVYEFLIITPEMQELILGNPSTKQIWDLASKQGSKSLFEDGLEKVKQGVTTLEELVRVAEPPNTTGYGEQKGKNKKSVYY